VFFLLRAYQWHPEPLYAERALAYLKAYYKYFTVDGEGHYREDVHTDGTDRKPGQFANYWPAPIQMAKAAVLTWSLTRDPVALELAMNVVNQLTPGMSFNTRIERSLISDEVEAQSSALSVTLDLYELTGDGAHLARARALADDAVKRFLYRGLFVSTMQVYPEGDKTVRTRLYDARTAAGWLALNLIRLQRDVDATDGGRFRRFETLERIYD
jgi:uncharacterized protein YyaL (SSP411 family)